MGQKKKKKRGGGGGRKGKGRAPSNDHSTSDDQELLYEELTALSAIFQDDFEVLSQPPHAHFTINLRPHTDDAGNENPEIVAILSVRCSPGYPYKCPKLQVEQPGKGVKKEDVERLLSLLHDQATSNAREGQVMIFNLVEAAQEYLSEISSLKKAQECVVSLASGGKAELRGVASALCSEDDCSDGLFVYGLYDLFGDLIGNGGSFEQNVVADALLDANNRIVKNYGSVTGKLRDGSAAVKDFSISHHENMQSALSSKPASIGGIKNSIRLQASKLNALEEENEDSSQSTSSREMHSFSEEESSGKDSHRTDAGDRTTKFDLISYQGSDDSGDSLLDSQPSKQRWHDEKLYAERNDLLMAYVLRLACSTKASLSSSLSEIAAELYNMGLLSGRTRDLVAESPLDFNKIFNQSFEKHMVSSSVSQFWRAHVDSTENSGSLLNSRYLNDFEEIRFIGHGGFGHVVLCRNKLDGRQYAVKKIRLKSKSSPFNEKILREVATLSRLQHQHVVRYYQAWFETQSGFNQVNTCSSVTGESFSSYFGTSKASDVSNQVIQEFTYLYIQMEYCPRTLRQDFETPKRSVDKELTWHLFRQISEGLAHIHAQGIIHRDLTPNNIFFDARNDIKIGDFGLAKFLKLEKLDQDHVPPDDTAGTSTEGTGQVGTYYYTAPEIEQGWPQFNEKVDMYSLGVVFFELWHPFETAMERHHVLSDLKLKASLPSAWVLEFPEQASLVQRLMSPNPLERPSAKELLRHSLPPRMEDEWLNDILRTIQTAEDSYVYDQVIATIFDEERINFKAQRQHGERAKTSYKEASFMQHTEVDTEFRDIVTDVAKEVCKTHGAKRLEISPMRAVDNYRQFNRRRSVKVLSSGGELLELCYELRSPFVNWIVNNQKLSFKRYEISWIHRKAIGHSAPNRFLQGDFDIIGGTPTVTVAEIIKAAFDILSHFFHSDAFNIRLNHGQILAAIWSWVGIEGPLRQDVANVLSSLSLYPPQSSERRGHWTFIRRQLLQGLNLAKSIVDRLQTVDLRFCGSVEQSVARLRGALSPADKLTRNAFDEISMVLKYLRAWRVEENISIDVLMPPEESYYRGILFQVYLITENSISSVSERNLLAIGGSYDHLLHTMWDHKSTAPSGAGVSLALEKILHIHSVDIKPSRHEPNATITVLVCSRGGGGLLEERMDLVAELWQANIKADFVPLPVCSLTTQYDYATEHDMKLLIIITEAGLSQTGLVEVRNLELKREKKIERGSLVQFVSRAVSTQFRSLSIWN